MIVKGGFTSGTWASTNPVWWLGWEENIMMGVRLVYHKDTD